MEVDGSDDFPDFNFWVIFRFNMLICRAVFLLFGCLLSCHIISVRGSTVKPDGNIISMTVLGWENEMARDGTRCRKTAEAVILLGLPSLPSRVCRCTTTLPETSSKST